MHRGYVRLWRKALDSGWLKNHRLWIFWSYALLKATHKEFTALVGTTAVDLSPGQFVFGLRIAHEETGLTIRQIRTCIACLIKAGNMTIKTTNKFSIITIVNWHIYQGLEDEYDTPNDKQTTSKRQHTNTEAHKNKKSPEDISLEISSMSGRYDPDLLTSTLQALSGIRKTGKMADSVKMKILRTWAPFPVDQVQAAMRTFQEKGYADEGKDERYLLGIIRRTQDRETGGIPFFGPGVDKKRGGAMRSCGSVLLDRVGPDGSPL
jgi:hypothetical protein